MMLKKNVLVWLALLLLYLTSNYALNVRNVHAQNADVKLSVAPSEYYATKVGEVFQINVTLEVLNETAQIVGVDFRISYNDSILEVLNVEEGPFFKKFTQGPSGTFFVYYIEDETVLPNGTVIPPHIIIGALIFPNETGQYPGPFPNGSGTIAMITFKAIQHSPVKPLNCTFEFFDTMVVNAKGEYLTAESEDGYYEIAPLTYEYSPRRPVAGQEVTFDASVTIEPEMAKWYYWQFDDGTTANVTEQTVKHTFSAPGTYNVSLTVRYTSNLTLSIWKLIEVSSYIPFTVKIECSSLYFRGEICEYNILTTYLGRPVNANEISAALFFNGSLFEDLTSKIEFVATGYYRISYVIPSNAENGTYTLIVNAKYNGIYGASIKSFLIGDLKDYLNNITTEIGIIKGNLSDLIDRLNEELNDVEASLSDLNRQLANITQTMNNKFDAIEEGQNSILTTFYLTSAVQLGLLVIVAAVSIYLARKK